MSAICAPTCSRGRAGEHRRHGGAGAVVAATALGADDLVEYLEGEEAATTRDRIWDSVYSQAIVPAERPDDRSEINSAARALHYLEQLTELDAAGSAPSRDALQSVRLAVPPTVVPPADATGDESDDGDVIEAVLERLRSLEANLTAMDAAMKDLRDVDRAYRSERLREFPTAALDLSASDAVQKVIDQETLTTPVLRVPPAFVEAQPSERVTPRASEELQLEMRSITVPEKQPWVLGQVGQERLKTETLTVRPATRSFR